MDVINLLRGSSPRKDPDGIPPAAQTTIAALRADLALEQQRIRQAFHEEYMWMRSVHMLRGGPATASEEELLLFRLLMSSFACKRVLVIDASAGLTVSWACVMGVRTLRATGWMNLTVLKRTVALLEAQNTYGDMRLDMLMQLAELCVVVACVAPRATALLEQCNSALCCALRSAANVYSTLKNYSVVTAIQRSQVSGPLFLDLRDLCPRLLHGAIDDLIVPMCKEYTDVHSANAIAQLGRLQQKDAYEKFTRLHSIDPDGAMRCTRAVLQYRMAQNTDTTPAKMPLLSDEWLANNDVGQPCALPQAQEQTRQYSRFAELCERVSPAAILAVQEHCIRPPPHQVCESVFL